LAFEMFEETVNDVVGKITGDDVLIELAAQL
jgi:GGDEF domain-containing protein